MGKKEFFNFFNNYFLINLLSNIFNFIINCFVSLWLTSYLIRHLGVAAYGLVPLAVTVVNYLELFPLALNGALGRFGTIALDRQDHAYANRIFNTSFWGTAGVLLVLLVPTLWLSFQAQFFFNVPPGYESQFVGLFLCVMGMFFLTTLSSPFGMATFCRNRFDLANAVKIAATFLRVACIVLLFNLWPPQIWHVGLAMLISSGVGLALSMLVCRHLMPWLEIQRSAFSLPTLKQLTNLGGWIVVNQIGTLLYLNIDLIVVNKMIGAEAGGQYGAVMMWSGMLRSLAVVVAAVFAPTISLYYCRRDIPGLVAYSRRAVKFLGLLMALSVGLVCGFAKPLLRVWLGPAFEPLAPLMMLMTIHLGLNLAVLPLLSIQIAANRVRLPGLLTCILGAGNLGLAAYLAGPGGWGMYGVAAAGAIMLTARNLIYIPSYGAHILRVGYGVFFRELLPVAGMTAAITGAGWWLAQHLQLHTWFALGLAGLALAGVFALVAFGMLLTGEERSQALHLLWPRRAISTR